MEKCAVIVVKVHATARDLAFVLRWEVVRKVCAHTMYTQSAMTMTTGHHTPTRPIGYTRTERERESLGW